MLKLLPRNLRRRVDLRNVVLRQAARDYDLAFDVFFNMPIFRTWKKQVNGLLGVFTESELKELIAGLLKRFMIVDETKRRSFYGMILDCIFTQWGLQPNEVAICAAAKDGQPDSSQLVVYEISSVIARKDIVVKTVNNISNAPKFAEKYKHWVIVDDFSGTGKTLKNRRTELFNTLANKRKVSGIDDYEPNLYCCTVACMEQAARVLASVYENRFYTAITLKRGISDFYQEAEVSFAIGQMKTAESFFNQSIGEERFPSLGSGGAEALFAFSNGNTPNSVFPVFWWRHLRDGRIFDNIFSRQARL